MTLRPRNVNWKNVGDNYSDALHIPVAHPGLTRLFGATYRVESKRMGGPHGRATSPTSRRATGPSACTRSTCPTRRHLRRRQAPLVGVLQAVAELRVRRLSGPGGHHAVDPDLADADADPRDRLRAPGRAPRNARRALLQLAHQPAGERRGHACSSSACRTAWPRAVTASGRWRAGEVALRSFGKRLRSLIPECARRRAARRGWSRAQRPLELVSGQPPQARAGARDGGGRGQHDRLGHLPAARDARGRRQPHADRLGDRDRSARSRWRCCSASSRGASRWRAVPRPTPSMRSDRSRASQASLWYWAACLIGNVAIATAASGYLAAFFGLDAGPAHERVVHHRAAVARDRREHRESAIRRARSMVRCWSRAWCRCCWSATVGWCAFDAGAVPRVVERQRRIRSAQAVPQSLVLVFWAFTGLESASVAAAVVENPERNVPHRHDGRRAASRHSYIWRPASAIFGLAPAARSRRFERAVRAGRRARCSARPPARWSRSAAAC